MAAQPPLNRLSLVATSLSDDLGFIALADLSTALCDVASDYRIIGGHMMTALVARWGLGADLYRETGDADLGAPPLLLRQLDLVQRLGELGYEKVAGDRLAKQITDIPAHLVGAQEEQRHAFVDILVPAYTSRARSNRAVGGKLVVTEVHGLAEALLRPSLNMDLTLHRLDGSVLNASLSFPDEVAALLLKASVSQSRRKDTDIVDLWRCLEVCYAAGIGPEYFPEGALADAAVTVKTLFETRRGQGIATIAEAQGLSEVAVDARFTRIRALIERTFGS